MNSEDWITAMDMDGTDEEEEKEKEKEKEEKEKDKDDGFKTPPASPRGEGEETRTPDNPFSHTPPFGLPPNTPPVGLPPSSYSTPQSTPGTPGRLTVVTEKDTP